MKKRLLLFAVTALMLLPLLCACNGGGGGEASKPGTASGSENLTPFGLPEKDWGGEKFRVAARDVRSIANDIAPKDIDTENSNVVNEASYKRAQMIKEKYGIELVQEPLENMPTILLKNELLSGTCEYDGILDGVVHFAEFALGNTLLDLKKLTSLDLSHDWWDQSAVRDMTVKNHLFYLMGDFITADKGATWVCFFNKSLYEDYAFEKSIYEYVDDGTWTIDQLHEMAKRVGTANNITDSTLLTEGTFGLLTQTYDGVATTLSFGQRMLDKDADDLPYIAMDSEASKSGFIKMFGLLRDGSCAGIAEVKNGDQGRTDAYTAFSEGRGLFQYAAISRVQDMANYGIDFTYGIAPMPKLNTQQDQYYSTVTVYNSFALAIPATLPAERYELAAYALEAMGYYGQTDLRPAYYEQTLKLQKLQDENDGRMLDLIFDNRIFDLGMVFDFGGTLSIYTELLRANSDGIESALQSKKPAVQASINEFIEKINKL